MNQTPIENIEIDYLKISDYEELKEVMQACYVSIPDNYWTEKELQLLMAKFPEGQIVIRVDGKIVGCALAIRVAAKDAEKNHSYFDITGNYSFDTHSDTGDVLYGIDVLIHGKYRGLRLGRRLYDYRKELCERLNLKAIIFGGRIPNYHKYMQDMSPGEYIKKVKRKEISDPVLDFQLANDFHTVRILKKYLKGDSASGEYAVLLRWENIYYEELGQKPSIQKTVVRIGLVQWQMRPYKNLEELLEQAEFFVDALSDYHSDFALFPEYFNAPLMAGYNHLSEPEALRKLAGYTEEIVQRFSEWAISRNMNIITGSMPQLFGSELRNVGYLCRRDGSTERYEKLHVTPDEVRIWGMQGGKSLKCFDTDCGKIGVLICYDSEFPELSRLLADEGMEILFVPFLTDTQNGFYRVKNCAQARAIENECYVAIAGCVGNLPKVHNMDIQFAHSMVFTPCDFAFPTNGIKAEATPNTEMILIADLDTSLLKELHQFGSVRNLRDRRKDLYKILRRT